MCPILLPEARREEIWVTKDSGELQKIVSLGVRKPKKNGQQHLHHHMLFGRVSINILLAHPKTTSCIFRYQTRQELQMGLASMVRWNKKNGFLAAKHPRWPEPYRKWEDAPSWSWNLKGLEWFWMKGWLKIWLCCGRNKLVHLARGELAARLSLVSPKVFFSIGESFSCHRWSFGSLPLSLLACLVGDTSFPAISPTWFYRYYLNWTELNNDITEFNNEMP